VGNVQLPMAAAIVAGLIRASGWWSVPILTKLTTGVGVLWYAFRRQWRAFGIALAVTAGIVAVSFALAPQAWLDYVHCTVTRYGEPSSPPIVGPPLPLRVLLAVALVLVAARLDWPWLVPIACGIAIPGLYGWVSIASVSLGS